MENGIENPRLDNEHWAGVLVQALPYFRHWVGKTVVVKYGGNAMLNEELKSAVMEDIVLLNTVGIHVVLVHGGGPEINKMLDRVGKESKFVNGLRYTDAETMEIVQMVLTGKLNKDIVGILLQEGGKAVGLSGVDSGLLRAKKIDKDGADLGFVGEVTEVHPEIVQSLLEKGFIPVISTVALGESGDFNRYNINADTAAAKIAVALGAEKFVQLTNVPGVLRDVNDPKSLIQRIHLADVQKFIDEGIIAGGMIPKIECCMMAREGGVPRTHIIDGRVPHSLLIEMFSDRGIGTMIY
ncbi:MULTISPECIES: acetylglutamate kinase [Treponema]|uniref:Acetylglutamate kinase n=1 Tax=Treponema saccharophilum DSM 2985 TaxID=907348 RepID=H7ELQ0_9SPIR|nr:MULTISPECIES: acetylglutamate kinase [Treponema]EIC01591.1 N-acetylglutamate kinase [Treponema saccharophilum DSM 2985]MBQ5538352.1 acetylglutamate kinase [Treponema sp.]BDC95503.1 acetylglutamate kinase [Treponema saccharophilum]